MPRGTRVTPELREIVLKELETIRIGAPFGLYDIRVFAKYDGYDLDNVAGATILSIVEPLVKSAGKNVCGQGLWVRV